jgi:hypothetical protein
LLFFNFEVLQLKKVKIKPIINRYEVQLVFICYDLLFFKNDFGLLVLWL